jgi:SAM-dependent methyltransferase
VAVETESAVRSARAVDVTEICACPDCFSALAVAGAGLRCTACGHEFEVKAGIPVLLPTASGQTEQRYVSNYQTIAADDLVKPLEGNRPARHEKLRKFIGSVAGQRVLDIGSSDAEYLRHMDASVKVALDIAMEYLVAIPHESGVIGVCGDAERLPIKAGYFDVVIISDVLEHVLHPEEVVEQLARICGEDTRLIVHVPWEEDLSKYRESEYEFTHLRSFNSYNFATLFADFDERRSKATYPNINAPLPYRLYGVLPRPLYNWLIFSMRTRVGTYWTRKWELWVAELPRREWWLGWFYRPLFRMFEFRPVRSTLRYRLLMWLRSKLKRASAS